MRSQGSDYNAGLWDLPQIKVKVRQQDVAVQWTLEASQRVASECVGGMLKQLGRKGGLPTEELRK